MNKVDEQPNNVTIVVVLVSSLVVGILTTGIPVVYESCWRNFLSAGRGAVSGPSRMYLLPSSSEKMSSGKQWAL